MRTEDVLCVERKMLSVHILLKCSETRKRREQFLSRKLFIVNEEAALRE
jgi:hypothetical protein